MSLGGHAHDIVHKLGFHGHIGLSPSDKARKLPGRGSGELPVVKRTLWSVFETSGVGDTDSFEVRRVVLTELGAECPRKTTSTHAFSTRQ